MSQKYIKTKGQNLSYEIQAYEKISRNSKLQNYVVEYYPDNNIIMLEDLRKKGYILLSEFQKEENYKNNAIYPFIVKNLINGLNLLHQDGIYHLDIKGNNIFIKKDTGDIKYIDFGSSIIDENLQQIKSNTNFTSNNQAQTSSRNNQGQNFSFLDLKIKIPTTKKNSKYIPSSTIYYILKEHVKNLTKQNLKLLDRVALGLVIFNIFPNNMKTTIDFGFYSDYNSYIDFIKTELDKVDDIIYPENNSMKQYLKTNLIILNLNIIQEKNNY